LPAEDDAGSGFRRSPENNLVQGVLQRRTTTASPLTRERTED
jgi:hypothetical protein